MDQEPTPGGTGGKSGMFQNINTVIAGITGLVIAMGGLAAATKGVVWDKEDKAEEQSVAATTIDAAAPAKKDEEAAPVPQSTLYKGDLYNEDDEKYDGGSIQLEQNGERWILTVAGDDEKYKYDQLSTNNKDEILATSPDYTSSLRWPAKGGVVEESKKTSRDKWETYGKVDAAN